MRASIAGLISGAILCCALPARAQYRSSDPCAPQAQSGGAFSGGMMPGMPGGAIVSLIGGMIGQQSRDQACAAERRAQWEEYDARQKAARDTADAVVAHAQEQQPEAGRKKDEADHEQAVSAVHAQRQHAAADLQARHARTQRPAASGRDAQAAQQRRRMGAVLLARAENAPDNHCRAPEMARSVLDAWNGLDAMKAANVKAIDIEHLTTVSFDAQNHAASCHGVFVTNRGFKIVGTATVKRNVAGDPMFVWERDDNQGLATLAAPPPVDANAPELAHAVHIEQASSVAPSGAPAPLLSPATLSLTAAQAPQ